MDKKVDESWKEQIEKEKFLAPEKSAPARGRPRGGAPPAGEFPTFLSTLSMQTLMSLGEIPHPATQMPQVDLEQARYLIDILGMLQEKTKGNLTAEEATLMEDVLYELRMKYVAKTEGTVPPR